MKRETFGKLSAIVRGGTDGEGGGTGPVIVLLHGFGAPGTDLVDLASVIDVKPETRFVFLAAPIALGGPYGNGRAWWHIDMMALEEAMMSGRGRDLASQIPEGLAEARAMLSAALDEVVARLSPASGSIVLGGFSQGAMLSCDLAFHEPGRKLDALVVLSGTLLAESEWVPRMAGRARTPVFQSHGTFDPVLPYALAEKLCEKLTEAGASVDFVSFSGAHGIPMQVLTSLGAFLGRL